MTAIPAADAAVVDFEPYRHGEAISDQYLVSEGVTIAGANFKGGPNLAIVFDSRQAGTADPDLEAAWTGGNLSGSTSLGNLLILAENATDANADGFVDSPDDQGSPAGSSGELGFTFATVQGSFGLDLIGVDGAAEASVGFLAFRSDGAEVARVSFAAFVDPGSSFYDPTVEYGDRFANRIAPITAAALGIQGFDEVIVNTGLCSAVDGVRFEVATVPEPSSAAIIAAALVVVRGVCRRRTRSRRPAG